MMHIELSLFRPAMINLYEILKIEPSATEKSIQAGIAIYRLRDDADDKIVAAARQWLLNPSIREQYDRKLFAEIGTPAPTSEPVAAPAAAQYHVDSKLIPSSSDLEYEHLYQFLGVRTKASYAELADAIDEAVLEGLNGKTIQLARETLLDPDTRAAYDAEHGIESAAAIVDVAEPVSRLPHTGLRLPKWLSFGKRKHAAPVSVQPESVQDEIPDTDSGLASAASKALSFDDGDINSSSDTDLQAAIKATPAPTAAPKPQFKRDNWYQFLSIRGDASFQEIKVAIRNARLKGRDKELIRQAQNMLVNPGNRRLYDKQNNIPAYIAAQNGDVSGHVKATDYRTAPLLMGMSLQKILISVFALIGLASALMPWTQGVLGLRFALAWPLYCVCILGLACVFSGDLRDPVYRPASRILLVALLPVAILMYLLGARQFQYGVYWGIAAMVGMVLMAELVNQQSRNVSYRAKGQQLFALLALGLNLLGLLMVWWFIRGK
ncbi:hypothetical protein LVJ82_07980 [Vitreoscilla massiliensis]|uniref:J domain-containing protein n=1 Tax=Vitreoscilla massiliensis TaxID=1689272 RepID=A0ABY4E8U3_9NEIS|nr:hypothetical protein [Vitreoscilla massiliensis]UOO90888.1 hypothetical protein LVJ82_07980 [Vitreoscilla massiliensis]